MTVTPRKKAGAAHSLISIVIPTKNCASTLQKCLESIRAQDFAGYEIIVVDGHSRDGTGEIARRLSDRLLEADLSVPACRNMGFRAARGEIFLSMDSDMVMGEGLLREISGCMESHGSMIVPELGIGKGLIARCKALEKLCYVGDTGIESARAFTRAAFMGTGGYDPGLLFGEDRDLHCRIAESSTIGRTTSVFFHDAGNLTLSGCLRKAFRYGRSSRAFFSKKHPGKGNTSSVGRLIFMGRFHVLAREPFEAACLLALKFAETFAFAIGYLASYAMRGV
jgi:glycosyltransferase involved in cell wall biosynthesis